MTFSDAGFLGILRVNVEGHLYLLAKLDAASYISSGHNDDHWTVT